MGTIRAHDSPEHVAERLTAWMAEQGVTPLLLQLRATEYRVLGQLDKAAADLEHALRLQPGTAPLLGELSRIYLAQGNAPQALTTIEAALRVIPEEAARGAHYLLRSEVYAAMREFEKALADCERAFRHAAVDLDGYIVRSQLQSRLGRWEEALAGLQEGFEKTGSAVLEVHWIDVMIDAGRHRDALERIEPHLAESRFRSSWLLRRARARLGLGEKAAAQEDLEIAIAELNQRLRSARPDLTLLANRGLASVLLGDHEAGKRDLATARQLGAEAWMIDRLEQAVNAGTKERPEAR